jgi:ABC-2 type transport system ATP-binding protein
VWDVVTYLTRLHGAPRAEARDRARKALERVGLGHVLDRSAQGFSKGMRQRAKLAGALVHDPTVMLLDEPFNGMDPRQRLHMMALLRSMAAAGRTILFSSHILEEVERLADSVLVVYAGRLAAAGDFRSIRRLMTDRPHTFTVRSSDDRRLASALVADTAVFGVELVDGRVLIRTADYEAFTRALPRIARATAVSLYEMAPTDDSLESVFSYLVRR